MIALAWIAGTLVIWQVAAAADKPSSIALRLAAPPAELTQFETQQNCAPAVTALRAAVGSGSGTDIVAYRMRVAASNLGQLPGVNWIAIADSAPTVMSLN
jgi:hypothetical protein